MSDPVLIVMMICITLIAIVALGATMSNKKEDEK